MAGKKAAMLQCLFNRGGGVVYRSKGLFTRSYSSRPQGLSASSSSSSQHLINLESQHSAHKYVSLYFESFFFSFSFKIIIG